MNGHGIGKFILGMTAGMAAGTALGMTMAPSQRRMKRAAHKAAKHVSEAVEILTDATGMCPDTQKGGPPSLARYLPLEYNGEKPISGGMPNDRP